jgi:hypothetical protein
MRQFQVMVARGARFNASADGRQVKPGTWA